MSTHGETTPPPPFAGEVDRAASRGSEGPGASPPRASTRPRLTSPARAEEDTYSAASAACAAGSACWPCTTSKRGPNDSTRAAGRGLSSRRVTSGRA